MDKRHFQKALVRLKYLPQNKYFFRYLSNKVRQVKLKITRSTRVAYPATIMIELTNLCNLSCTICPREYRYGKEMDKGMMAPEQAEQIIDEVWPYLDSIGLTGMGETFLYKDLERIVDYIKAKNRGIIISISTNAVVPDFVKKVKPFLGKLDTIQISIDGLHEVYNSIRKGSDFDLLNKNLRELAPLAHHTGTTLMLNMVVTKENYRHMPLLVEYANDIGIKYLDFTLFNLASVTDIDVSYYNFFSSEEFLEVVKELENRMKLYPGITVTGRNFKTDNGFRKCPFPWTHFYVTWDGYVPPCCAKPFPKELNFGNVFEEGVINVLNSEKFRHFREMWFRNETPDFCKKCHFIGIAPIKQ